MFSFWPLVEAGSLNHWTTREVPAVSNFKFDLYNFYDSVFSLFLNLRLKSLLLCSLFGFVFKQKEHLFFEVNEKLEGLNIIFSVLSFSLPELLDFQIS